MFSNHRAQGRKQKECTKINMTETPNKTVLLCVWSKSGKFGDQTQPIFKSLTALDWWTQLKYCLITEHSID